MTDREIRKGRFLVILRRYPGIPEDKLDESKVPRLQFGISGPREPWIFLFNASKRRQGGIDVSFWNKPEPPKPPVDPRVSSSQVKELKEWLAQGAPGNFKGNQPSPPLPVPTKTTRFYEIWHDEDHAPILKYTVYLYLGRNCQELHLKYSSRRIIIGRGFSGRK